MASLKKVKKLEERIAPSAFAVGANYRCGNGFDGEVPGSGYPGGHIDPNTTPTVQAGADAGATGAAPVVASGWGRFPGSAPADVHPAIPQGDGRTL